MARAFLALSLLAAPAFAQIVGLGSNPGFPWCASACARTLAQVSISCSSKETYSGLSLASSVVTEPACYAGDTPYLTTLAWCVHTRCMPYDLTDAQLDTFWDGPVVVNPSAGVDGEAVLAKVKWSYAETLEHIPTPPTKPLNESGLLNYTAEVLDIQWLYQFNTDNSAIPAAIVQAQYGYVFDRTRHALRPYKG